MNTKKEIKKIKINNGAELIAKAKEYKNSGGEWKLRERYIEMPWNSSKFGGKRKNKLGWGIIISNRKQTVDIFSPEHNIDYKDFVEKDLISFDEINVRPELWQLFPEAKFAHSDKGNENLNTATCKELKKDNEDYSLYRYLVAENSWHLKSILHGYVRENETKIYQSANPHFSGWVEIVDSQDGNVYLYVGEKNTNGGREIKIGITKSEFEKCSRNSDDTPYKCLEDFWALFTINRPRTPAEERKYYSGTGGLEQEWQENWPHRQGLCRKYLEELRERMNQKFNYWQVKTKQKNYWDHEANKQGNLAHAHMSEIDYYLADMKKNRPEYYFACDKDCAVCGIKLCCHFEGQPCEESKNNLFSPDSKGSPAISFHDDYRLPAPVPKSNQITEAEKKQLLQYFLEHHISKISVENGQLKIEYSQKGTLAVNNSELRKYRQFIQNLPSHSLSLKDLEQQNNSSPFQTNPNNNKLVIGLTVGAGATILIGAIAIYFLKKPRPKRA